MGLIYIYMLYLNIPLNCFEILKNVLYYMMEGVCKQSCLVYVVTCRRMIYLARLHGVMVCKCCACKCKCYGFMERVCK